ncbi:putative chitinase [Flavobacterium sp. HSC-32F16]|uniref:CHAP domain-containing protein n=1 Tax=Flavobacterium sp. HSC-32F16 TaxID=2910964 RepID=UPI0020A28FA3|nr:CHAP domain-containing protein [Flavobacterium sp. HSC-32F16]MCP2027216.1 putative chitinase [Flavobacterium sp. HSC-32F16]
MSKVKIYGNPNPVIGIKEYYSIHDFFGSSAPSKFIDPIENIPDENIKWSVWILLGNEWVKMTKNNKTGATVDYTFYQQSLDRKGIRMLVDANGEKAVLDIKTKKNTESKILHVEILDSLGKKPTKLFSYGETITARIHCLNMEKFRINVTLWENDGGKKDLSDISIQTKETNVQNGKADVEFTFDLGKVWLVNAKSAPGELNEGAFHEYYVTAEFYKKVSKPTENVNVINPDYKEDIFAKVPVPKPSKKETRGIAKSDKKAHDYQEQKIAVNTTVVYDPQQEFINSLLMVGAEDSIWNKNHKDGECLNCIAAVKAGQLKKIFTQTDLSILETVGAIYTKYMKELGMDTCWNKAHFFAQAVVESGKELTVKGAGESFNYLADDLHLGRWNENKTKRKIIFSYFATHRGEAYQYGRIEEIKNGKKTITQYANQEMIAKLAYGPNAAKGVELGNTQPNDGWDLRGRGLVQLTGRAGYEYANNYTKREGADIVQNPDLIVANVAVAVLSSMAFFKWKGINKIANEQSHTKLISQQVGNDVPLANGKRNHTEKQEVFTKNTAVVFETDICKYGEKQVATDLKIQQGINWLESIAIDQKLADDKSNYKVLYSQDGDRTSQQGEDVMDCSELICRYLQKIEWSSQVLSMNTSALYTYAQNNSKWLEKHNSTSYKPKVGDIFIWKNDAGSNGHTGVVVSYDKTKDVVTTIEAIKSLEKPEDIDDAIQLQGVVKLKWRRLSKHLMNHPVRTSTYTASTCRFYTPKVHYSKQDKK